MAHSMGGNILLRRLHDVPDEFAAAILCAPMLGINPRGAPWWLVERIAYHLNRKAPSTEFVWGMADRDQLTLSFRPADRHLRPRPLCPHPGGARRRSGTAPERPHLGLAGGGAACHRIDAQARLRRSDPDTCAISGRRTATGSAIPRRSRAFAARMPHARCVEIAGAEHEILMERDVFRAQFWSAFDRIHQEKRPSGFPLRRDFHRPDLLRLSLGAGLLWSAVPERRVPWPAAVPESPPEPREHPGRCCRLPASPGWPLLATDEAGGAGGVGSGVRWPHPPGCADSGAAVSAAGKDEASCRRWQRSFCWRDRPPTVLVQLSGLVRPRPCSARRHPSA